MSSVSLSPSATNLGSAKLLFRCKENCTTWEELKKRTATTLPPPPHPTGSRGLCWASRLGFCFGYRLGSCVRALVRASRCAFSSSLFSLAKNSIVNADLWEKPPGPACCHGNSNPPSAPVACYLLLHLGNLTGELEGD